MEWVSMAPIRQLPPCRDDRTGTLCPDRKPGCHSGCGRYLQWKQEVARVNDSRLRYSRGLGKRKAGRFDAARCHRGLKGQQ